MTSFFLRLGRGIATLKSGRRCFFLLHVWAGRLGGEVKVVSAIEASGIAGHTSSSEVAAW